MLKFLSCVQLYSNLTKEQNVTFSREAATKEDKELILDFNMNIIEDKKIPYTSKAYVWR